MQKRKYEEMSDQEKKTRRIIDICLWTIILAMLIYYGVRVMDVKRMEREIQQMDELGLIDANGAPKCTEIQKRTEPIAGNKMYIQGVRICEELKKQESKVFTPPNK